MTPMRRISVCTTAAALLAVAGLAAHQAKPATQTKPAVQTKPAPPAAKPAQIAASPLTASAKVYYTGVKKYLLASAEEMPATSYAFKPAGVAAEVRGFGEILGHVADENFVFCAAAAGTKAPASDATHTAKTKIAFQKALAESFAFCDTVWAGTNDANAATPQPLPFSLGDSTRLGVLIFEAAHDGEHYGNVVTYLRAKGLVPPSSQPAK
jgi:uncharacterized damage-inducible protein DinB